jgi:hypothetical protein
MSPSRYTGLAGPIPVSRSECSRSAVTSPNSSSSGGRSWHTRRRMSAMTFWTSSCSLSSSAAVAAGSRSSKCLGPPSCSHDAAQGDAEPRPWCRGCSRTPGPGAGCAGRWRKMSGWPNMCGRFTAFVERRAATTSWFFPASTDTRTYAETIRNPPFSSASHTTSASAGTSTTGWTPERPLGSERLHGLALRTPEPSASRDCLPAIRRPPTRTSGVHAGGLLLGLMRHPGANRAGSWRAACLP